ncbi:hypothetical protein QR685DRAFT_571451 [Neurospora intermedia]|uniref:Uncharacterized protein n=1 Tax=Neurospora intermedia TaxID=5142 RepID=A0ABR3DCA9_NEUIN
MPYSSDVAGSVSGRTVFGAKRCMTCRGRPRERSAVTVDMSMIQKATQFDKKRCALGFYPWGIQANCRDPRAGACAGLSCEATPAK